MLDRNTGLVWEKSLDTARAPWSQLLHACINKNVGGQKGWRLPAIAELASLIDLSVSFPGPTLPSGHPFVNAQNEFYWSASTSAENPAVAWGVGFASGSVNTVFKDSAGYAWCVRGGSNADVY